MEKPRNTELNFLYTDEIYGESKKNKKAQSPKKSKVRKKNNRAGENESAQYEDLKFNFDNEIVIGVTRVPDKNTNKSGKKTNQSNNKIRTGENKGNSKNKKSNNKTNSIKSNTKTKIQKTKKVSKKNTYTCRRNNKMEYFT